MWTRTHVTTAVSPENHDMTSRTASMIRFPRRLLLCSITFALLAASTATLAAPASGSSHDHAKGKIILQHHTHADAPDKGSKSDAKGKIILQHHTHTAAPGKGSKPAAKNKIILQHHGH